MDTLSLRDRFTQDSGMVQLRQRRDMVSRFGLMARNMKDFGRIIWQVAMADSSWLTEMSTKASG
jgi:hypothetical protein